MRKIIFLIIIGFASPKVVAQYCSPSTGSGCATTFADKITNVTFSTINNSTGCDGLLSGSILYSTPNPNLVRGSSYTLSVTANGLGGEDARAWIDYNQNGIFAATAERVLNGSGSGGATSTTYTTTVTIPLTATLGATTMRVRCNYNGSATALNPCNDLTYGEIEDYSITIIDAITTPTANNDGPVCSGGTLNLSVSSPVATYTYAWTGPGGYAATGSSVSITGITMSQAGVYSVTASDTTSTSTAATTTVVVNQTPTATISGTTNFCSGSLTFVNFTGTPGATVYYNINGGSTLSTTLSAGGTSGVSTGTLTTGTSAATYTYNLVSATLGTCSQSLSGSAVITVNPNPSPISGTSTVCNGYTTTLSDPDAGGTWTTDAGAIATVVGSGTTGVVTGTGAGTTNVNYTFPTGCSATVPYTVNTTPAISGITHECEAATSLLTGTPGTGSWFSTNTAAATISGTGTVSGVAMGITNISYTLPVTGCYVIIADTVNPQPGPITGFSIVCEAGATTPLNEDSTDGVWSASNTNATVIASGGTIATVTGVTAGTVTISYTIISASGSCSSLHAMTINPIPAAIITPASAATFCNGDSVVLNASTGTGYIYQWSGVSAGPIIGATNQSYTAYTSDSYQVSIVDINGCGNTSALTTVTVNPLPVAITGPTEVCDLATITLSDATGSGTWSSSNANATAASGGVVTGTSAGTSTISYTLGTGCYATYDITINPIPQPITGTLQVCEAGSTTTLGETTTPGSWSAANGNATIDVSGVVTGVTAGTDNISYSLPVTGCYVTATVIVNPLPSPISGSTAVCVLSQILLSSSPGLGVWSSGTGNTTATAAGIITGVASGPDTITYTLGTGCIQTYPITVNALPAAIVGTFSVCEAGSTTILTDDSTGTWSSSDPAKATIDPFTGKVTGVAAGTLTITFTLASTGCYVTTPFTVNPLPSAITGPANVCAGSQILLGSAPATGTWSSDNNPVATVDATGLVSGIAQGTADITYTLGTGCLQSYMITVSPLPAAIAGTIEVCQGLTVTLTDDSLGGTWSSSDVLIASAMASTGIITGTGAGTTTITYTLPTGCISTTSMLVDALPSGITGATDVCNGSSTLFSDATTPGTWSSQDVLTATVDATGMVTGTGLGTTNITYTLGTGCIAVKSITVDALPGAITGPTSVCITQSISLGDLTPGGTWSGLNNAVATVGGTGMVTGISADTVTIVYTNPLTTCYTTTLITVNPQPATITGTATVCQYATTTLSDASGTSTWTSQNISTATVGAGTGIVTGVNAGTTNITFTLPSGCFVTQPVTVNATPSAITGTTTVCVGSTTTLADLPAGGTWSIAPTSVATVSGTGVVTGVSAGTATVDYTLVGCSQTAGVTVNPQPGAVITPIGDTTMCPGDFVVLTANTGTGLTYQWYNTSGIITGATSSFYATTAGSFYHVKVTNTLSCTSTSSNMDVTVNAVTATANAAGPTTICATGSVTLNANTGAGLSYQWIMDGVGIAGATTSAWPTATAGNYQVVVSNTAGCSATSTPPITVNLLPTPSGTLTLSGTSTFCTGDSVTITADPTAGLTYQWYQGATAITGATDNVYTASATGIYSVAITNSIPCTNTPSVVITALALPSATITTAGGISVFCAGSSINLSVPISAGSTYQWYDGAAPVAGATNATYTATAGGDYTAQVTATSGCITTTNPAFTVTELTTPTINPLTDTAFCWGGSAVLGMSIPTGAGAGYQWQLNGTNITGATNSTYSAGISGDYTCTISVPGCSITSLDVSVTEHPLPNPVITYDGTTLSTQAYFTSYQWLRNGTAIGGATGPGIIPSATGSYEVEVSDTNSCHSVATAFPLTTLGVKNVSRSDIKIYPNPATSMIHVQADQPLKAIIYTVDGRSILEQADATSIDITNLTSGVYTLLLYDKNRVMVKAEKIVKE